MRSDGAVATPLDEESLEQALEYFRKEGVEALAVCFLFSYLNPEHEKRVLEKVRASFPDTYTSLSHQIIPQIKEFDRLSTTVINSYVGPVFGAYLQRLKDRFTPVSRASRCPDHAVQRRRRAHRRIQPDGGAGYPFRASGRSERCRLPGGTPRGVENHCFSTWEGPAPTYLSSRMGYPTSAPKSLRGAGKISVPMIDIHTLGAGGASIASVDPPGVLRVGPRKCRSRPRPGLLRQGRCLSNRNRCQPGAGFSGPRQFLGR